MNGGVGTVLNRIRFVVLVCFAVLLSILLIQSTDAVPPVSEIYASQIDMMNIVVDVVADEIDNVKSGFLSGVHVISDKFTHIHEFRLFRNVPSTCVDRGYDVVVCKCGHTHSTTSHAYMIILQCLRWTKILTHRLKRSRTNCTIAKGYRT